ncbi:MAG: hypothetical protein V2A79_18630, partial [Planctomycetota bacterium]
FLGINTLVARLFMAAQKIREGFWYQVVMNLLLIGLAAVALKRVGAIGYPLAQLAHGVLNIVLLYVLMRFIFPAVRYAALLADFVRMGAFNLVLAIAVVGVRALTAGWSPVASLLIGGAVFGALFVAGNAVLPLDRSINETVGAWCKGLLPKSWRHCPGTLEPAVSAGLPEETAGTAVSSRQGRSSGKQPRKE